MLAFGSVLLFIMNGWISILSGVMRGENNMCRRAWSLACLLTGVICSSGADPKPADFDQYKTIDQATVADVKKVTAIPPPPGHFGLGVESVQGKLVVTRMQPGGAAEQAGLQPEDVLLSIDGLSFGSVDTIRQFLVSKHAGQTATVMVERKGQPHT